MGKVIAAITTSVDGYVVGPQDGPEYGLGIGGERLHYWVMGGPWTYADDGHDTDGMHGPDREYFDALTEGLGCGIVGRNMYDAAGAWGGTNPFPGTLIVLTHRTEDQPDPSTGFLFIDGFDAALLKARELAGDGSRGPRWRCRPDPPGSRGRGRRRARDLDRAGGAGRRQAAVRGVRAGPRPRGAGRVELAVRHPRAVRRQAVLPSGRRPRRRDDGARRRHDRDAEDGEERVAAGPLGQGEPDAAQRQRQGGADRVGDRERRRVEAAVAVGGGGEHRHAGAAEAEAHAGAGDARTRPRPATAGASSHTVSHSADRGAEQRERAGQHRLLAGRPAGRAGPGPGWPAAHTMPTTVSAIPASPARVAPALLEHQDDVGLSAEERGAHQAAGPDHRGQSAAGEERARGAAAAAARPAPRPPRPRPAAGLLLEPSSSTREHGDRGDHGPRQARPRDAGRCPRRSSRRAGHDRRDQRPRRRRPGRRCRGTPSASRRWPRRTPRSPGPNSDGSTHAAAKLANTAGCSTVG